MDNPKIAQKFPYLIDVKPGKYAWCACGLSNKQPYCDGSHKDTGYTPVIEEVSEEKKIAWCGCKHSKNGVYCDGSHNNL